MALAVTLLLLVILSDFGCHGNLLRRGHNAVPKKNVPAYFALREVRWQLVAGAGGWVEAEIEVIQLGIEDLSINWMQSGIGEHHWATIVLPGNQQTLHQEGGRTYITSRQQVTHIPPGQSCELLIYITQIVDNGMYSGPNIAYRLSAILSSDFSSPPRRTILEVAEPLSFPDPIYHYDNMENVSLQFQSLVPSNRKINVELYSEIASTRYGVSLVVPTNWDNIIFTSEQIISDDGQIIITTYLTLIGLEKAAKYHIRLLMDDGRYFQTFVITLVPHNQHSIYPHNVIQIENNIFEIIRDGIMQVTAGNSISIMCHAFIPDGSVADFGVLPIIDYSTHDFVIWLGGHFFFGYTFLNVTEAYAGNYTCSVGFVDGSKLSESIQLEII